MSDSNPKSKIIEDALVFQGDLVHLLEEPLPKGLRGTIYYFGLLIVIALFVSIVFKVDVVVQGTGKLTYDGQPIVLQPFQGEILRTLNVRPGDSVKKGQVLATLDATSTKADLDALRTRQKQLRAHVNRLTAESSDLAYVADAADGESGKVQQEIYNRRMSEFRSRMKGYDETLGETQSSLKRTEGDIKNLEEQLAISRSIEGMQENLFNFNTNSKLEFLTAQNNRLRAQREFQEATERLIELKHRAQTVIAQKESFSLEWRRNIYEELSRQRAEQSQVESSMTKSVRVNSMVEITAPEDGVVLDIANRSVGSVLRDAEPLVIIIPSSAPLITEIQLSSSAVGEAAVGDKVLVKVDAFPYQRYGGIKGWIRSISFESHAGGAPTDLESVANKRAVSSGGLHRVSIDLEGSRLEKQPDNRVLFPGMTVTAEIYLGKRRVIHYILSPILRGLRESFREP